MPLRLVIGLLACQAPTAVPPEATPVDRGPPPILGTAAGPVVWPEAPEPATWNGDIRALVDEHCAVCHSEGGGAPFVIDDAAGAAEATWAVLEGSMPPAQFDPTCRSTVDQRWLDAEGVSAFASWQAAGFPQGDPAAYVPPEPPPPPLDLGTPDLVIPMDAPYLPDATVEDETVAFTPTFTFPETTWVSAARVVPGIPELVHHATVFVVDDQGNPLFGDALADSPSNALVAWAPGNPPWVLPEGAAFVVPAGAMLRIEIHYSVVSLAPGAVLEEDLTSVELWTRTDPPDQYAFMVPFDVTPLEIPADEAHVEIRVEGPYGGPDGTIVAVAPHMHLRGVASRMDLAQASGGETCLVDVPNFDFEFQSLHWFPPEDHLQVDPADVVTVTCTWNNSAENQPVVGGVQLPSVALHDGPGTLDEMCQVAWLMLRPYGP